MTEFCEIFISVLQAISPFSDALESIRKHTDTIPNNKNRKPKHSRNDNPDANIQRKNSLHRGQRNLNRQTKKLC